MAYTLLAITIGLSAAALFLLKRIRPAEKNHPPSILLVWEPPPLSVREIMDQQNAYPGEGVPQSLARNVWGDLGLLSEYQVAHGIAGRRKGSYEGFSG